MSFVLTPIKDVSVGVYDGPHATPKESNSGRVFLGIKNVTPEGRLDLSEIKYVSEDEFPKWTKRVTPQEGDVVFSYEATLHRYAIIPGGFDGCLGRRMGLVRPNPKKLNSRFLHYSFLPSQWKKYADTKVIVGATVNRLPIKDFPDFLINIPSLDVQDAIVEVLSNYDDLIENNRRRIQLLEESARLLYKEWFVQLRFPGHEHVKIVDGVPEGWSKKSIDQMAKTIGGGTPSTKINEYWEGGDNAWFSPTDLTKNNCIALLGSSKKITDLGMRKSSAKSLPPRAILMSSRASIGYFGIYEGVASTNQGFISMVPYNENQRWYILHNLMSRVDEIVGLAGGTTFKEINKTTFRAIELLVPNDTLLEQFSEFYSEVYQQVLLLKKQTQKLEQARDILLPRLMNGTLTV